MAVPGQGVWVFRRRTARMTAFLHRVPIMRKCPSLSVCFLLAVLAVPGAAWARDVKVGGMGIRKCSEWTAWKTAQNGEARATAVEWAQGFLAAHNVYSSATNSVVAESRVIATLLDAYCQKNPEERLVSGVADLVQNLGGAKINMAPKAAEGQPVPRPDPKGPRES